ncbi:GIDE domain-containing protein [Thiorhodovibrio frisius]|uniref:RING-type E3 ubiquitin transferase n=1 Tax=Thiorhodovibrio frisius TaxID=631362 RepID=H8Z4K0_9GAMM|nr:GIDE domain-containing protein [Thiorhodovibrio frisius]EIC20257.1 E3 Ubiquitin ligase [Thiorhodovibrio frisius]WPL20994.1 E3 Ubiquitin ligase [Thiorhodovibrio frisius]
MNAYRDWVLQAETGEFWFIASGALIAALVALVYGLRSFWQLRIIVDTPTAKIRSAAQGYVELFGFARVRSAPLIAPLTQTPCVWYRYQVEEQRSSSRNKNWRTVKQGQAEHPFLLDDGTGECLVDPTGAILRFRDKQTWRTRKPDGFYGGRSSPTQSISNFFGLERNYRLTEERIHADEPVYLLGHFETPRRGSKERRRLANQLLRRWKRDPERMRQFDRNQDGEIDLQDWQQAREQADKLAEQAEQRLAAKPPLPRVGNTSTLSQPFIISTQGADALASGLRWRTGTASLATLLLGAASGAAMVIRLGG